ncbi:MAG: hypothetical protein AAGF71_06160, partial [Pseudomonadota bacterium]
TGGGPSPQTGLVVTETRPGSSLLETYGTDATGSLGFSDSFDATINAEKMTLETSFNGTAPVGSRILGFASYSFARFYIRNRSTRFTYDVELTSTLDISLQATSTAAPFSTYRVSADSRVTVIRFDGVTGEANQVLGATTFFDQGAALDVTDTATYDFGLTLLPGQQAEIWVGATASADINFGPPAEVPLPSTAWLLGTAFVMAGSARRWLTRA